MLTRTTAARLGISIGVVVVLAACGGERKATATRDVPVAAPGDRQVANLRAFARLYGAMRWFHPSDEAAAIDWDRYAVIGVRDVRGATDGAALERALAAWVAPIGPSVQILGPGETAAPRVVDVTAPQVAWQHQGPGFDGGQAEVYRSRRTNREGRVTGGVGWGSMAQTVDATALRGRKVRLQAQLRAGARSRVGAWLRVDLPGGANGFFDNMQDRSVRATTWTPAVIVGEVAADAERVVLGGLAWGNQGWFDGFQLEVDDGRGGWTSVALTNPDFDGGVTGWKTGIGRADPGGFTMTRIDGARDGGAALQLAAPSTALVADLYAARPSADEVAELDLGEGLRAVVPLSLASQGQQTLPIGDAAAVGARIAAVGGLSGDDLDVRISDVVVAWNVLAHFYPYHDVIATRWTDALDGQLAEAVAEATAADHHATLAHLMAATDDGHGGVTPDPRLALPLMLDLVEGAIVVRTSGVAEVERGDVVIAVDGVAAATALDAARALASGSPQWRTLRALHMLGGGPAGTVTLQLERAGQPRQATVTRGGAAPPRFTYPAIAEHQPGVWLVDLSRVTMDQITKQLPALAKARGVVFDLRGYPRGAHDVLRHLLPSAETDRWMHVAQVIRPGGSGPAPTWESFGWDLTPATPRLRGQVVFLTGPGAISYAESVMGYVEALKLPIVGAATAGANGNVRQVTLPSSASIRFTGMKVTRHDGTRSHVEGIRPTVAVEPTLAGIRAGRDEVLERALTLMP